MLTNKNWDAQSSVIFMAVLLVVMLTGCTPPGVRALLDGDRLIGAGKHAPAIDRLKLATEMAPPRARPQAWNFLGLAYHGNRQVAEAIQCYQRALQLDPNFAAPHFNLGCLFLEQNNPERAAIELGTYTVQQRNDPAGWAQLGSAHLRGRQFDQAEQEFRAALKLNAASAEALNGLGIVQLQRRRQDQSVEMFRAALKVQPDYAPAVLNLGIVHQHYFNDRQTALRHYREYLQLNPPAVKAGPVQNLARQLELELAPVVKTAPTNLPPANVTAAQPGTNISAPLTNVRSSPELRPRSTEVVTARNTTNLPPTNVPPKVSSVPLPTVKTNPVLVAQSPPRERELPPEPSGSKEETNRIPADPNVSRKTEPAEDAAPLRVVKVQEDPIARAGVATPEVNSIEPRATDSKPNAAPNTATETTDRFGAGMIVKRGKTETSAEKGGIAQKLNPVTWFRGKPKTGEALETRETASPARPAVPSDTHVAASQPPPAQNIRTNRSISPSAVPSRPAFARYGYRSPSTPPPGNRRAAEPFFSDGLRAHKQRRMAAAIEAYQKAIQLDPAYFEAQYNLGLAAYDSQELPRSLLAYEYALAISRDSVDARYNFALALQRAKYPIDSVAELKKLISSNVEQPRIHFLLAKLYSEQLNDVDAAKRHYRRVLELEPQHPFAMPIRYWLSEHP
jgi:tetratricopeptide (TPR) repeat protein